MGVLGSTSVIVSESSAGGEKKAYAGGNKKKLVGKYSHPYLSSIESGERRDRSWIQKRSECIPSLQSSQAVVTSVFNTSVLTKQFG